MTDSVQNYKDLLHVTSHMLHHVRMIQIISSSRLLSIIVQEVLRTPEDHAKCKLVSHVMVLNYNTRACYIKLLT